MRTIIILLQTLNFKYQLGSQCCQYFHILNFLYISKIIKIWWYINCSCYSSLNSFQFVIPFRQPIFIQRREWHLVKNHFIWIKQDIRKKWRKLDKKTLNPIYIFPFSSFFFSFYIFKLNFYKQQIRNLSIQKRFIYFFETGIWIKYTIFVRILILKNK